MLNTCPFVYRLPHDSIPLPGTRHARMNYCGSLLSCLVSDCGVASNRFSRRQTGTLSRVGVCSGRFVVCVLLTEDERRVFDWLNHPMRRLLSSKGQGCKVFWKPYKPCHVGMHWIALTEYSQMSTHVPGLQSSLSFSLHYVELAKLATISNGRREALLYTFYSLDF